MKRWGIFGLALLIMVGLGGCETMQGLGRDISKAGEKIEGAAKK
jgi:predicted small secreted protein